MIIPVVILAAVASFVLFHVATTNKKSVKKPPTARGCDASNSGSRPTEPQTNPGTLRSSAYWQSPIQSIVVVISIHVAIIGVAFQLLPAFALAAVLPLLPLLRQKKGNRQRRRLMYNQMDSMLANLANAISVSGNLTNAIEDVSEGEPEPMRTELRRVLHEVRLGTNEDDALQNMAERSDISLFRTAITAMIVGKRSGGKLGEILTETAASIQELKRLDGVLKTKTAEARTQAWVMGLVPFFLCGVLQLINPEWLTPLWTTPFGWVLIACALLLETAAVLLIRKILSVAL